MDKAKEKVARAKVEKVMVSYMDALQFRYTQEVVPGYEDWEDYPDAVKKYVEKYLSGGEFVSLTKRPFAAKLNYDGFQWVVKVTAKQITLTGLEL